MRLKNIIVSFIVCTALFASCQEKITVSQLDQLKLSQSIVAIPVEGGQVSIEIQATESWKFDDATIKDLEWLTISPLSGEPGNTTVTFSAESTLNNNNAEIRILVGEADENGKYAAIQYVNVLQKDGNMSATVSTIPEVISGVDGKIYRVTGTCTSIANTTYGNWYLSDDKGNSLYIYGTLYEGQSQQFLKHNLEVGDKVTVEGPKLTYGSTIELVDVTVIEIEKSLIKVESDPVELPIEGGEFEIALTCKGNGVSISIPEDAKSWLSVVSISQNGNDAAVKFLAQKNELGDRMVELTFSTNNGSYTAVTTVSQKGSIIDATADEINAAEDGSTIYRITGYITKVTSDQYGNFYLADHTGSVYVYGTLDAEGNPKNWASLGIKEGDIVTITGPKTSHKGDPQMKDVTVEKHSPVTDLTVSEFIAKEKGDAWYRITGTITSDLKDSDKYGNFDIEDETGSVYVYGLLAGYGGPSKEFQNLISATGLKKGDKLTLVGKRTDYNGTPQVGSAFYVSHVAAE